MGKHLANQEIVGHCQAAGTLDRVEVRYHYENKGRDDTHALTAAEVAALRARVDAADEQGFYAVLASAIPWWGTVPAGERDGYWCAAKGLWS